MYLGVSQKGVVVACYKEFVRMGLRFEPGQDIVVFVLSSGYSEVACMNEDVGVWEKRLGVVGVVGVGNANNTDFVWAVFRIGQWWRSVQESSEEKKRR